MQKPVSLAAALGFAMTAMLGACASSSSGSAGGVVALADGLRFTLRSPASFGEEVLLVQAATLSFGADSHELLFHTEISAQNVVIVGSLPNGTRLFSIAWNGSELQSEGYQELLASIPPAYFVADLQLAQWPLAAVLEGFADSTACFNAGRCRLNDGADQLQRTLEYDGEALISIQYAGVPHYRHDTRYEHHGRHYRLQIETLDVQMLTAEP